MKKACMSNSKENKNHNKHKNCCCGCHSTKAKKKKLNKNKRQKIIELFDNPVYKELAHDLVQEAYECGMFNTVIENDEK